MGISDIATKLMGSGLGGILPALLADKNTAASGIGGMGIGSALMGGGMSPMLGGMQPQQGQGGQQGGLNIQGLLSLLGGLGGNA